GALNGFIMLATAATVVVILVYMLVMLGSIVFYLTEKRAAFNPFLHLVFPIAGIVLFAFPLFYQYHPLPPYPVRYAAWFAVGWICAGIVSASSCGRRGRRRSRTASASTSRA